MRMAPTLGSDRYTASMANRSLPSSARSRLLCIELLEDRRVLTAGVTIITHGAQFSSGLPDWTVTMGQAVLDRADGARADRSAGSLFQHDPGSGQWRAVGDAAWINSNSPADQIVLLYDWSSESLTTDDGWIDAAADNLFASLLAPNDNLPGALHGTSFFDAALAAGGGGGLLDFHFIGHSRGGVLNSLVAERFDKYFGELTIDQVTTLDPHPAGPMNDPGYVTPNPSANSRVFTYDNVRFADNYFQSDGAYEPFLPPDYDGVVANGAYNFQIPTPVLVNGGSIIEHSDVHSWYYGTITAPFAANYAGFSGAGRNNDGDSSFPEAWWGSSGVPARAATGFAFSTIGDGSRAGLPMTGSKITAGAVATIADGDMQFGVDGFSDSLPGWEEHGGAGSGPLGGDPDLYVELNSGGDDLFRRHNPLYFPRHTAAIEYDYWISDNDAVQPDDRLQVLVGGTVVDEFLLPQLTNGFIRDHRVAFSLPSAGLVATLEFRLRDDNGDGVESAVRFDNVELVIQPPASSADFDGDGDADGADFLSWQRGLGAFVSAKPAAGDADFDGNILADDLAVWRAKFAVTSVVEPASVAATMQSLTALAGLPPGALVPTSPICKADARGATECTPILWDDLLLSQTLPSWRPSTFLAARPAPLQDSSTAAEFGPRHGLGGVEPALRAATDAWFTRLGG
jgi:hypothetical protein